MKKQKLPDVKQQKSRLQDPDLFLIDFSNVLYTVRAHAVPSYSKKRKTVTPSQENRNSKSGKP